MMSPLGIAIIGGGVFVKEEHLPAVLKCDLLALKAIYSRTKKSAAETANLIEQSSTAPDLYSADSGSGKTYDDLLLRNDIEAVIIALPIISQPEYIEAALKAGKHVLAEKPIAPDVAGGKKLIDYYRQVSADNGVTFGVAENVRFWPSFAFAALEAKKLGRVTHFATKVMYMMEKSSKWYATEWRAKPQHQGGFLLDGGVHFVAGTRLLLSDDESNKPVSVQAFSDLTQDHLPPVDSVVAIIKTKSGATGSYQQAAGSRLSSFEWGVACEGGSVKVVGETVTVKPADGEASVREFTRTSGVCEEVTAWAQSLVDGSANVLLAPEEALADLELLEKMLKSGEQDGASQTFQFQ